MIVNAIKYGLLIAVAFMVGQLLLNPSPVYLTAALVLVSLPIFIIKPHYYFIGFILFRPLIDISIQGRFADSNISSLVVIPLIILCFKDIFFNRAYIEQILANPFLRGFNTYLLFFILIAFFSFFNTEDLKTTLADFARLISLVIATNYAVVFFGTTREGLKQFTKYVIISAILPLIFGIYQFITRSGIHELGMNRLYGTFGHCNVFAEYLFLVIFLSIFAMTKLDRNKTSSRLLFIFLILLCGFCFYHTFTRTLWIAFAVALFFYVLLKKSFLKKFIYLFLIGCVLFGAYAKIHERFAAKHSKQEGRTSWEWRMDLWKQAMKDIKRHPIAGHGLGMFEHDSRFMAHNDFLRLSYETGIPGAVIFYGVFFYILIFTLVRSLTSKIIYEKDKFALAFSLTLGLLIASMGVNTLRSTVIMFYFLMAIALLAQKKEFVYENTVSQ
jgi:O-antigen ligase